LEIVEELSVHVAILVLAIHILLVLILFAKFEGNEIVVQTLSNNNVTALLFLAQRIIEAKIIAIIE
jgi:hypothetical protein